MKIEIWSSSNQNTNKLKPRKAISVEFGSRKREERESNFEADRLALARRRLQENYKEAENAKRQRTIQVMDLHEIPRLKKNAFFAKNKCGGGSRAGQW